MKPAADALAAVNRVSCEVFSLHARLPKAHLEHVTSGDFDEYWRFHEARELKGNHLAA